MSGSRKDLGILVAGFGSPHGDDQAGWKVIDKLARSPDLSARILLIREGTQLIGALDDIHKLIVIDACRSGGRIGTITRYRWPDQRIQQRHNHSTHGIGLCHALELADKLGLTPPDTEIFGIEISCQNQLGELNWEVAEAVDELTQIILAEMNEAAHA